jgi:hypothetical protein
MSLLPSIGGEETVVYSNNRFGPYVFGTNLYCLVDRASFGGGIYVDKSIDGGATFTEISDAMSFGPYTGAAPFKCMGVCKLGTKLYVFYNPIGGGTSQPIKYSIFDTGSDTWSGGNASPTVFNTGLTETAGSSPAALFEDAHAAESDGTNIYLLYTGASERVSGLDYDRVWYATYDGVTWSAGSQVPGQTGNALQYNASQVIVTAAGRIQLIYTRSTWVGLSLTELDLMSCAVVAGVFKTPQVVATDPNINTNFNQSTIGIGAATTSNKLVVPYVGGGATAGPGGLGPALDNRIAYATDADNPTWATVQFDATKQMDGFEDCAEPGICSIVATTSDLFVFWLHPTARATSGNWQDYPKAGQILWSQNAGGASNPGGGSWTAPATLATYTAIETPGGVAAFQVDSSTIGILVFTIQAQPLAALTAADLKHYYLTLALSTTATLTLQKVVSNTHGGTAVATDWTVRAIGPATLSGAGSASSPGLPTGTYALSEGGPPGYSASSWVCVGGSQSGANITLAGGDVVTCTITNSDVAPGPPAPPSMCEPVTVTTPTPSLAAYNEATEKQGS